MPYKDPMAAKLQKLRWYEENREAILAQKRAYRKSARGKRTRSAWDRAQYKANPERFREAQKAIREQNTAKYLAAPGADAPTDAEREENARMAAEIARQLAGGEG